MLVDNIIDVFTRCKVGFVLREWPCHLTFAVNQVRDWFKIISGYEEAEQI